MKKIDWEETFKPMSPDEIERLEADLGGSLPADYRRFLADVHGYMPVQCDVDVTLTDGKLLQTSIAFLCARGNDVSSVRSSQKDAYEGALRDCIPFAEDGGGNYFCLEFGDGSVTFFFHERSRDGRVSVASDFAHFMDMLYLEQDTD
jgi:hypothetical protein